MSKIGQKIVKALQLDHKWVRVMLTISLLVVVVVFFLPQKNEVTFAMREIDGEQFSIDSLAKHNTPIMDTTVMMNDSSNARIIIRRRQPANIDRMQPVPPPPPKDTTIKASEPIQVQIVEAEKPFDWKGIVTWGIGAMNGLILVFLNLKNLLFKKNS